MTSIHALEQDIAAHGFAFAPGARLTDPLRDPGPLADLAAFSASWDDLFTLTDPLVAALVEVAWVVCHGATRRSPRSIRPRAPIATCSSSRSKKSRRPDRRASCASWPSG